MRSQKPAVRPRLETLEDRTLLSTCHVTRLADTGTGMGFRGDLRFCINKVNSNPGADIIDFHVTGTINLTGVLPDLASDIDIQGPGADSLTVRRDTGGNYRIFNIPSAATVEISGLTIANGNVFLSGCGTPFYAFGGGILNDGSLTVENSTITGNVTHPVSSCNNSHALGGGIYNGGTMTLRFSTVSANTALVDHPFDDTANGGGIHNAGTLTIDSSTISANTAGGEPNDGFGGGISSSGTLSIINSTVSGNKAFGHTSHNPQCLGGGISASMATILNSTITGNSCNGSGPQAGGGIALASGDLRNTIVAGNQASSAPDFAGNLSSSGFNLFGNSSGGSGYVETDFLDVDPMLGALTNNGGPTQTHALLLGSPAIDVGDNTNAPDFDQRGPGFPRIVNGTIDIGAFEVQASLAPSPPRPDHWMSVLATADLESLF